MSTANERWRWVKGYEGKYMVSSLGNVLSVPRSIDKKRFIASYDGKLLSLGNHNHGYKSVVLYNGDSGRTWLIHRLVAEAFIPNPDNKPDVNHKNGNKADNRVENLEWVTCKENSIHAVNVLGKLRRGALSDSDIERIRNDKRQQHVIAGEYGLCQTEVSQIQIGKAYKYAPGPIREPSYIRTRQRKLSQSDVLDILSSNETGVALARKYNVAASTIHKIRKGQRYKEVPRCL